MSDEAQTQETPKDLREALERQTERATEAEKAATAAVSELREFKAQTLLGNEKHAELFLKVNPEAEITRDAVNAFVKDYGLTVEQDAPPAAEKEERPDPGAGLGSFGEAAGSGTGGGTPAAKPKMSPEDFSKLLEENPQAAAQAYIDGTAPRNELNVQARALVEKGIIDH